MTQPVWGVTPQGFNLKPQTQIQQDITTSLLSQVDAALDTSPTEPLGQLIGVVSEALAEVWELLATAYEGIDRDNAEGDQLDNVGTLTGSQRNAPTASQAFCNVTLAAGGYGPGVLVAAVASTGPATTESPSIGVQFTNVNSVVSGGGTVSGVLFEATTTGPTVAPAGWLTAIAAPVSGWSAITNPSDATVGRNLEDDTDYRARQEQELTAGGGSTLPSVTAALLELFTTFGLPAASVNVIENVTLVTDPVTLLPGKSFEVYVYAGPSPASFSATQLSQIALTIWNEKPAGIQLVGSTSQVIFDSQGVQRTVPFSIVNGFAVNVIVTVIFSTTSAGNQAAVAAGIGGAIQLLAQGETATGDSLPPGTPGVLVPGGTVYGAPISSAALDAGGIVQVVSVKLALSPTTPTSTNPLWGVNDAALASAFGAVISIPSGTVGSIVTANITIVDAVTGISYPG